MGVNIIADSVSMLDSFPYFREVPWASWKNFIAKVWKGNIAE